MHIPARKDHWSLALRLGVLGLASTHATLAAACCNQEALTQEQVVSMASAVANAYTDLRQLGCNDADRGATATCSGEIFSTWQNVRALVHTANELSGTDQGPTQFSLKTDAAGLAAALRWHAGEEFASHASMLQSFNHSQQTTLNTRINSLRSGNPGTSDNSQDKGLNSGDELWSQLGGFINGSYNYGNLGPSAQEDAYDFDGSDINAGIDYRINNHWVVGAILGHVRQTLDFDASLSTVDGGVKLQGTALTTFLLYEGEMWYFNGALGYQANRFATERGIHYGSLNPTVANVDTLATSHNKSHTLTGSASAGYSFQLSDRLSLEPSLSANYQKLVINGFQETDINNQGLALLVQEQNIASLQTQAGLKMNYVFSNRWGVFTPYMEVQSVAEHRHDPHLIKATYANIADLSLEESLFALPSNGLDRDYKVASLGIAAVVRGASQATLDAPASGGIQVYLNWRNFLDMGNYHQKILAAGLRYEF